MGIHSFWGWENGKSLCNALFCSQVDHQPPRFDGGGVCKGPCKYQGARMSQRGQNAKGMFNFPLYTCSLDLHFLSSIPVHSPLCCTTRWGFIILLASALSKCCVNCLLSINSKWIFWWEIPALTPAAENRSSAAVLKSNKIKAKKRQQPKQPTFDTRRVSLITNTEACGKGISAVKCFSEPEEAEWLQWGILCLSKEST